MLESKIKSAVRDIQDFPKPGIIFKDITPILKDHELCREIISSLADSARSLNVDAVAGIESRGFLFGPGVALELGVPFIPIRKAGKLPYKCVREAYDLEYGEAVIEIHEDALPKGAKVLLHDDLLATGGTILAASSLLKKIGAEVAAISFVIDLSFLKGRARLDATNNPVIALATYQ